MKRRELLDWITLATAVAATGGCDPADETPDDDTAPRPRAGKLQIGMLVYPKFTALDLIGPQTVFSQMTDTEIHLVWKTLDPVTSDSGITLTPTRTFATCPQNLGILFVPGGTAGTVDMMEDPDVLAWLAARGATATWVTSVCTGSLVLGAAGLLRGYQATTHWVARDVLALLEATPMPVRYHKDRNRITGAGITSGIDFALRIVDLLRTAGQAQTISLNLEYAPDPPYPSSGSPETAPPGVVTNLEDRYQGFLADATAAAEAAAADFPP